MMLTHSEYVQSNLVGSLNLRYQFAETDCWIDCLALLVERCSETIYSNLHFDIADYPKGPDDTSKKAVLMMSADGSKFTIVWRDATKPST